MVPPHEKIRNFAVPHAKVWKKGGRSAREKQQCTHHALASRLIFNFALPQPSKTVTIVFILRHSVL